MYIIASCFSKDQSSPQAAITILEKRLTLLVDYPRCNRDLSNNIAAAVTLEAGAMLFMSLGVQLFGSVYLYRKTRFLLILTREKMATLN